MTWHTHPSASQIVRDHWAEAECFLVAQSDPCIQIRDDEVANIDRLLHGGFPEDLEAWNRPAIWFVAVVICPDDDLRPLVGHVRAQGLDPARFHFYLHPATSIEVLRPWADAGFPLDRVDDAGRGGKPLADWQTLHALLGLHFNLQILHSKSGASGALRHRDLEN